MVLLGSGGVTRTQLEKVLGTDMETSRDEYSDFTERLFQQMNTKLGNLHFANGMYVAEGFPTNQIYRIMVSSVFSSDVEEKNFISKKLESVREVRLIVS